MLHRAISDSIFLRPLCVALVLGFPVLVSVVTKAGPKRAMRWMKMAGTRSVWCWLISGLALVLVLTDVAPLRQFAYTVF